MRPNGFSSVLNAGPDQPRQFSLIAREAGPFEIETADLALEFANRPVATQTFDLVERALEIVIDGDQFGQMREGKPVDDLFARAAQFGSQ